MINFGAGVLFGTPLQDGTGAAISNPSPIQFGVLQEVSVDESWETKMLHGANQFPIAIGRGKGKVSMKAKAANFNAALVNTFLYGTSLVSAYENIYNDITGLLVPTSTFAIAPTAPSSGSIVADLGVVSAVNGAPLTRVASSPTSGQYSYSAGTWTFSNLDYGLRMYISFAYSATVAGAKKIIVPNNLMGVMPVFTVDLATTYQGKTGYVRYPNVVASSFTRTYKNDDFTIPEFQMDAFADYSGNISYLYLYE